MIRKPASVTTLTGRSHYLKKVVLPELTFPTEQLYGWVKGLRGRKAMRRGLLFHSLIRYIMGLYAQRIANGLDPDSTDNDKLFMAFVGEKCQTLKLPYPLVTEFEDFLDRLQCILLAYLMEGQIALEVHLTDGKITGHADMIAGTTLVEFKSGAPCPDEDRLQLFHYIRLALLAGYNIKRGEIVYITYATPYVRVDVDEIDWAAVKIV